MHKRLNFPLDWYQTFGLLLACLISSSALHPRTAIAVQPSPSIKTGPAVGDPIPPFRAIDQNGKTQDFKSIRGPKGALILFFRSADW
jgi:hypothetical protein